MMVHSRDRADALPLTHAVSFANAQSTFKVGAL